MPERPFERVSQRASADRLLVDCVDRLLNSLARGQKAQWDRDWAEPAASELAIERFTYHGMAGFIIDRLKLLVGWPDMVVAAARDRALAVSMWELRHREVLSRLLDVLASQRVEAVLLKGSALAYDLYPNPALRERGDSDLLVRDSDRDRARTVLAQLGYVRRSASGMADRFTYQEEWRWQAADDTTHFVDLHFQLINSPAYSAGAGFAEARDGGRPLPALGKDAFAPSRPFLLFHACAHRAMHLKTPYFSAGKVHFGGNRLIWLMDIDRLVRVLTTSEWDRFGTLAIDKNEAASCIDGLKAAQDILDTPVPRSILDRLAADYASSSTYTRSGQLRRAWIDMRSIPGAGARFRYAFARLLPSKAFIRTKYPDMADRPIVILYARRMAELVTARRGDGSGG